VGNAECGTRIAERKSRRIAGTAKKVMRTAGRNAIHFPENAENGLANSAFRDPHSAIERFPSPPTSPSFNLLSRNNAGNADIAGIGKRQTPNAER
jgi:hypothetical protein